MRGLLILFLLSGCVSSKAWIIEDWDNGGVIGYKMGDGPKAEEQLDVFFDRRANAVCGKRRWRIVKDVSNRESKSFTMQELRTSTTNSTYSATGYRDVRGSHTTTSYEPVTYYYSETWREALIECEGQAEVKWRSSSQEDE